jgi:hypothetical protein
MGVTLHHELAAILRDNGNRWMATSELAHRVNERGIYRKRDGSGVTAFQVHGRTRNYGQLFERDGAKVRLRGKVAEAPAPTHPASPASAPRAPRSDPADGPGLETVLTALSLQAARPVATATVAAKPGLYAVFASGDVWQELGLGEPPDDRPLYLGKAEDSLASRDLKTHFESGATGRSTLRRSLAALLADRLDLIPMPRNPRRPGYFAMYGLEPDSDQRLTSWMLEHLELAVWTPDAPVVLDALETRVLVAMRPPLNLAKVATEWSPRVSAARARMAARARQWRGAHGDSQRPRNGP